VAFGRITSKFIRTARYAIGYGFIFLTCLAVWSIPVYSQDDPDSPAPPPSQVVSRDEIQRLDSRSGPKDRTKLALELINNHLTTAEQAREAENFEGAYRELGAVHGLLDNAVNYLIDINRGGRKALDEFKRLEIGLRGFLPRIESIRRDMPITYDEYLRALLKHVRDARAKAVEPFFDDSIVRDRP
jgi:hypothetical protein